MEPCTPNLLQAVPDDPNTKYWNNAFVSCVCFGFKLPAPTLCGGVPTVFKGEREDLLPLVPLLELLMIWKKKGSSDDVTKCRSVALKNSCLKMVEALLLMKLLGETAGFQWDTLAGFTKGKGTRDNIFNIPRTRMNTSITSDDQLTITFVDLAAAFDSVSHKFVDEALAVAGASNKSRALIRAIYLRASAHARVSCTEELRRFSVNHGVLQGSLISPMLFLAAFQHALSLADERAEDLDIIGHTVHFSADGDTAQAVKVRMGQASQVFGKLHGMWTSSFLPLESKLKLYATGSVSVLTHAHETWILDAKVCKRLKVWNAKCLSNLTGEIIGDACRRPTWDLVGKLRARRLKWAGKTLAGEECLLRQTAEALAQQVLTGGWELDGTLLMDCVEGLAFESVLTGVACF